MKTKDVCPLIERQDIANPKRKKAYAKRLSEAHIPLVNENFLIYDLGNGYVAISEVPFADKNKK